MNVESVPTRGNGRGFIRVTSGDVLEVEFGIFDDLAIFQGDIILGSAAELTASRAEAPHGSRLSSASDDPVEADIRVGHRWPSLEIPFTIDPALPGQSRVYRAIDRWTASTAIKFLPQTSQTNFVTFKPTTEGCASEIGMVGGQQYVYIGPDCTDGNVLHEVGHVVGLWHEHTRADRDAWVLYQPQNLEDLTKRSNFKVTPQAEGLTMGPYDYVSIMHYPSNAFALPGTETLVPLQVGAAIGQRTHLSAGDIAAAMQTGYVALRSADNTDQAIDLARGSATPGTRVVMWAYDASNSNQHWRLDDTGTDSYFMHNRAGGTVATAMPDDTVTGKPRGGGSPDQHWQFIESSPGRFYIRHPDTGLVLSYDPRIWKTDSGPFLWPLRKDAGLTQQWIFSPVR